MLSLKPSYFETKPAPAGFAFLGLKILVRLPFAKYLFSTVEGEATQLP